MSIEVLELKNLESLEAFNTFHKLLFGLAMTPKYFEKSYNEFLNDFHEKSNVEKKDMLLNALRLVDLTKQERLSLLKFTVDNNNIQLTEHSIKNMALEEMIERQIAVCEKIEEIEIVIGNSVKKN